MSGQAFHEIYLHAVWHTKHSQPVLVSEMEQKVQEFLRKRCAGTRGTYLHGLGGTETHVHLAFSIEPFICISAAIGDLKGSCARYINEQVGANALNWQRGYGVVSFGKKQLRFVLDYVSRQKEHHAQGTTHAWLEKSTDSATP